MSVNRPITGPLLGLLALALAWGAIFSAHAACPPAPSAGEIQLSAAEVRSIFIGKPWHGPSGAFIFRDDGTYTYKEFGKAEPRGTWAYEMLPDGTLDGNTTRYTFFRADGRYRYFHSQSCNFYRAIPDRSF